MQIIRTEVTRTSASPGPPREKAIALAGLSVLAGIGALLISSVVGE